MVMPFSLVLGQLFMPALLRMACHSWFCHWVLPFFQPRALRFSMSSASFLLMEGLSICQEEKKRLFHLLMAADASDLESMGWLRSEPR